MYENHNLTDQDWEDIFKMRDASAEELPIGRTEFVYQDDDDHRVSLEIEGRIYLVDEELYLRGLVSLADDSVLYATHLDMHIVEN